MNYILPRVFRQLCQLLTVLLILTLPAQAASLPKLVWTVDFRPPRPDFDWARRYRYPLDYYETVVTPHSWSGDGRFLIVEGWYTGGSPIDTLQALYVLDLPQRANHRIFTTGGMGPQDNGIIWSWNQQHDTLYYQTRGGFASPQNDTGFWSWNLAAARYKYHPGPPGSKGRYLLRDIDGFKGVNRYDDYKTSLDALWPWGAPQATPVPPINAMEEPIRLSDIQGAGLPGIRGQTAEGKISIRQPGSNKIWARNLETDMIVLQQPQAPYDLFVAYRKSGSIWLERHRYGQSAPLLRRQLKPSHPDDSGLEGFWANRRHGIVLLTGSELYMIDESSLHAQSLHDFSGDSSHTLIANPQQSWMAVSESHGNQNDEKLGNVIYVYGWQ